jgi:2-alkyl-3-oxoalkanoate reductase
MKLLVTGATGFVGKYVVAQALLQHYEVRALIRPASDVTQLPWSTHPALEIVRLDLRQRCGLVEALHGVDGVLHLAAVKDGDFSELFAGTVLATENLLDAMAQVQGLRLVALSTFSVYDFSRARAGTLLDEHFPIKRQPEESDIYAETKLVQEDLIRTFAHRYNTPVTLLRPGMIDGREWLWNTCLGARLGDRLWLCIGARARMPLTYVENCAEAILAAVRCEAAIGQTINIVDDDLPTQRTYARALLKRMANPPRRIPINWTLMRLLGHTVWFINSHLLHGQAQLPGLFVPTKLDARFKSFRYSNDRAKHILQWHPRYTLQEALRRSLSEQVLLAVSQPEEVSARAPLIKYRLHTPVSPRHGV